MRENEISRQILDSAFKVHSALGPGFLESVDEVILAHELRKVGFQVERQWPIAITHDGLRFDEGFRADLLVERCVVVELKSIQALNSVHAKQVLTQLRLANLKLGLLINFGEEHLKKRNQTPREQFAARGRGGSKLLKTFATLASFARGNQ